MNTLEYKEKFDELFVIDIVDIINRTTMHSIEDIFSGYVTIHGVTNYEIIESTMKYLMKKNIIVLVDGDYKVNDLLISNIEDTIINV